MASIITSKCWSYWRNPRKGKFGKITKKGRQETGEHPVYAEEEGLSSCARNNQSKSTEQDLQNTKMTAGQSRFQLYSARAEPSLQRTLAGNQEWLWPCKRRTPNPRFYRPVRLQGWCKLFLCQDMLLHSQPGSAQCQFKMWHLQ